MITKMTLKDTSELFAADLRDPACCGGPFVYRAGRRRVEGFLYVLQKVARAHGMSQVAERSAWPRESLYRSLSEKGNPGIKPLTRVLESLGLSLSITPAAPGGVPNASR